MLKKFPGFIDVHVHLRDPGATHKEDFATGSKAAVGGGFTYILDMPNNPIPTFSPKALDEKISLAQSRTVCDIGFYFGTNGKNINFFADAANNSHVFGLKIYCNHTTGDFLIEDEKLLEKVFAAWDFAKPILVHAEGEKLAMVISLSKKYHRHLHVCHISKKEEVEMVRAAKKKNNHISAGVTPHHLFLSKKYEKKIGAFALMKPPLGTNIDQQALWQGIEDGTIDLIETDHAPHTKEEKNSDKPPYGVPGLETAVGLLFKAVKEKTLKQTDLIRLLFSAPKNIFKIPNQPNTYVEIDIDKSYQVDEAKLATKCAWSPFAGWELFGDIQKVVINGQKVVEKNSIKSAKIFTPKKSTEDIGGRPFYNHLLPYEENYEKGPFGDFSYFPKNLIKPKINGSFLGFKVDLPFGIPAGPLLNSKFVTAAWNWGYSISTYKTVRADSYPCHPSPNVIRVKNKTKNIYPGQTVIGERGIQEINVVKDGITNSFGVPSKSATVWQADVKKLLKKQSSGNVLILSFMGTKKEGMSFDEYVSDFVQAARLANETGAPILEVNFSCPNVGKEGLICNDVQTSRLLLEAMKPVVSNTPLLVKIGYFPKDDQGNLERLLTAIYENAVGVVAINTIQAKVVDKNGKQVLPGSTLRIMSGICGATIRWAGFEMSKRIVEFKKRKSWSDFAVVGVGGVVSSGDYFKYKNLGVDAVQAATGPMWRPRLAMEIRERL